MDNKAKLYQAKESDFKSLMQFLNRRKKSGTEIAIVNEIDRGWDKEIQDTVVAFSMEIKKPLPDGKYSLIGMRERVGEHESIIQSFGDENYKKITPLRSAPFRCFRCKREANRLFVVEDGESGKVFQVGKTCLNAFVGQTALEKAEMFERLAEILCLTDDLSTGEDGETRCSLGLGGIPNFGIEIEQVLIAAKRDLDNRGHYVKDVPYEYWFPCSPDEEYEVGTKKVVLDMLRPYLSPEPTAKEKEYATKVKKYWLNQKDDSEFIGNIQSILNVGWVSRKKVGYIACLPNLYEKALRKEAEKAEREKRKAEWNSQWNNEYVGQVKDKIELDLTLDHTNSFDTEFGIMVIHTFRDEKGRMLIWKTSKNLESMAPIGSKFHIKGTVKELSEFRGIKQTVLTRCKTEVLNQPSPAA